MVDLNDGFQKSKRTAETVENDYRQQKVVVPIASFFHKNVEEHTKGINGRVMVPI